MSAAIQVRIVEGAAVVEPRGDLDASAVSELRARLHEAQAAGVGSVVVDMARTTSLCTSCIGVMFAAMRQSQARGGTLCLTGVRDSARRTLRATGMDAVLTVIPSWTR
jgi:anti-anti-sigma factor